MVTVNELINKLSIIKEEGGGDLEVSVWADHGQQITMADNVGVGYITDDLGEIIEAVEEEIPMYEDDEVIKIVVIE